MKYELKDKKIYTALLGGAIIAFLILLPIASLKAEYKYRTAIAIIEDDEAEHLEMLVISEETIDDYTKAIALIEETRGYLPMRSDYLKREADLYKMLGVWSETMLSLEEVLPASTVTPSLTYARGEELLLEVLSGEPTNADYHLALAGLYGIMKNPVEMDKELRRVVSAYPQNAPLRHRVAMLYLLSDMQGSALEHARVLANIDKTYFPAIIKEGSEARRLTNVDIKRFYKSYLFTAFEIAWRISKDKDVVLGIAPNNIYAEEVAALFFDWRGVDE